MEEYVIKISDDEYSSTEYQKHSGPVNTIHNTRYGQIVDLEERIQDVPNTNKEIRKKKMGDIYQKGHKMTLYPPQYGTQKYEQYEKRLNDLNSRREDLEATLVDPNTLQQELDQLRNERKPVDAEKGSAFTRSRALITGTAVALITGLAISRFYSI